MVRNIIKGKKIFGRKAKPATEADKRILERIPERGTYKVWL